MKRTAACAFLLLISGCAGGPFRGISRDPLREEKALFAAGEFQKVVAHLNTERIQRLPRRHRAAAYGLLGQSHERSGNLNSALLVYQFAEGLYPRDINILSNLANLLSGAELERRARSYFERVLKIHPNNAAGNFGIARIFRNQGLLSKSQMHFEKTLAEEGWSGNPVIWKEYAELLADRQLFAEAVQAIHKSLDLRFDVDSLVSLARFLRRRGDREQAYFRIEEAILKAPDQIGFRLQWALWLLEDRRTDEALAVVELILAASPGDVLARWIRGSISLRRGAGAAARADFLIGATAEREHPFVAKACAAMIVQLDAAGAGH